MKTVTEFPGIVLREAARIRRAHRPQRPDAKAGEPPAEGQQAADAAAAPVDGEAAPPDTESGEAAAAGAASEQPDAEGAAGEGGGETAAVPVDEAAAAEPSADGTAS